MSLQQQQQQEIEENQLLQLQQLHQFKTEEDHLAKPDVIDSYGAPLAPLLSTFESSAIKTTATDCPCKYHFNYKNQYEVTTEKTSVSKFVDNTIYYYDKTTTTPMSTQPG